MRRRSWAGAKPPKLPECADCHTRDCHAVKISEDADGIETSVGYVWLCGSCEYLRSHPDAPKPVPMPGTKRLPLQEERLFDA